jgi:hypothetical protein
MQLLSEQLRTGRVTVKEAARKAADFYHGCPAGEILALIATALEDTNQGKLVRTTRGNGPDLTFGFIDTTRRR